jgi:NitT/TauT family transport system substrate-binding protein
MSITRRQFAAATLLAGTAPLVIPAGCGTSAKAKKKALDKVTYATGFGDTAREGFARLGVAKGFFRAVGIDVRVVSGQPSTADLKLLHANQVQFADIDFVSAVINQAPVNSTKFSDYSITGVLQDKTLVSFIARGDTGITSPADLEGKTVGAASPTAASHLLFGAYAKLAGVDASKVRWQYVPTTQLYGLVAEGQLAAGASYVADSPSYQTASTKAGHSTDVKVLPYSNYITDLYGSVTVTRSQLLHDNPDLVQRFTTALFRSIRWSVDHPDEAEKILPQLVPALHNTPGVTATTMGLMAGYIPKALPDGPGPMFDENRVARAIALLEGQSLIKPGVLTPAKLIRLNLHKTKS